MSRIRRSPSRSVIDSASAARLARSASRCSLGDELVARAQFGRAAFGFARLERAFHAAEPSGQVGRRARRARQSSGEAACLAAERLPAGGGRGRVLRDSSPSASTTSASSRARVSASTAPKLVPFPARGHRLGESLSQSVGLRAVADERRERSPFFFDRNQLLQDVVAVERFDAHAQRFARGEGLGAQPRVLGGRFGVPNAPRDRGLGGGRRTVEPGRHAGIGRRRAPATPPRGGRVRHRCGPGRCHQPTAPSTPRSSSAVARGSSSAGDGRLRRLRLPE